MQPKRLLPWSRQAVWRGITLWWMSLFPTYLRIPIWECFAGVYMAKSYIWWNVKQRSSHTMLKCPLKAVRFVDHVIFSNLKSVTFTVFSFFLNRSILAALHFNYKCDKQNVTRMDSHCSMCHILNLKMKKPLSGRLEFKQIIVTFLLPKIMP